MPRKYTKKNTAYWESVSGSRKKNTDNGEEVWEPKLVGDAVVTLESKASGSRLTEPTERTKYRKNSVATGLVKDRFANIEHGLLPYRYSGDSVDISDAVILCQKAYFNVPAFASTLNLMSEFADTEIYLKGGSAASLKFVKAFLKKIGVENITDQFFREWWRSGNVFFFHLNGRIKDKTIKSFRLPATALGKEIPIKYILLNPSDIVVNGQLSFGKFQYAKALTPFEIARLKNAKTDEEKELYESMTRDVKKQIKEYSAVNTGDQILLELEEENFSPLFYKKQDYEPLAVPPGFAVLDDINKKMELKKVDQAIARSIENVILLVTMGNEPDKGGINYHHIAAMQAIFEQNTVGRALVSDYSTRAEFIIPDLKKVMGKEKYEVLNQDIEEGLGNILLGESKYSDTELKLKLFFKRLEKPKQTFLRDFLQKEIDAVCKTAGFRNIPTAHFSKQDVLNSEVLQKLVTRMMELGIMTPEQGMETIHNGEFPATEDMAPAQEIWRDQREEGLYTPLVGSSTFYDPLAEEEDNAGKPADKGGRGGDGSKKSGNSGGYTDKLGRRYPARRKQPRAGTNVSPPSGGRPAGTSNSTFSQAGLYVVMDETRALNNHACDFYMEKLGVKELTEEQLKCVTAICMKVVANVEKDEWKTTLDDILNDTSKIGTLNIHPEILEIGATHQLDDFAAALLYHSTKINES